MAVVIVVAVVAATLVLRYRSLPVDVAGSYADSPRDDFLEGTIGLGSLAIAAFACVGLGALLFCAVRAARIHWLLGAFLFIPLSLATVLIPVPLVLFAVRFWPRHSLFSGDTGLFVIGYPLIMLCFSGFTILVFPLVLQFARPRT